ncbi:uncharacterized protein [Dendropsophus ebraccatus]|uniref:uncharacterized protein isoform X2 n=1 Tax=Dendropsophus ebraccatus TaxID=150705 RepID=UPI003831EE94
MRRSSTEDGETSQEPGESYSSQQSSLEMDCSEPTSDHPEGDASNDQEMKSAYSSQESCMDYVETADEEKEEENSDGNKENDEESASTSSSQNSITLNVATNTSGSQDLSPNRNLSEELCCIVTKTEDKECIQISLTRSNSKNSTKTHKRKSSGEADQETMNKRKVV